MQWLTECTCLISRGRESPNRKNILERKKAEVRCCLIILGRTVKRQTLSTDGEGSIAVMRRKNYIMYQIQNTTFLLLLRKSRTNLEAEGSAFESHRVETGRSDWTDSHQVETGRSDWTDSHRVETGRSVWTDSHRVETGRHTFLKPRKSIIVNIPPT